jgi:hypothetical protein
LKSKILNKMIEDYQAISNAPNSPDLNGKYLGIISTDFALVAEFVKEASYQIRTRGFSKYPIFAVSRTVVPVGSKLIGINEMNGNTWNYNATVAEFMQEVLFLQKMRRFLKAVTKTLMSFAVCLSLTMILLVLCIFLILRTKNSVINPLLDVMR